VHARRRNLIVAGVPPENGYPLFDITVQGGTFITSHRALARPNDRAFPAVALVLAKFSNRRNSYFTTKGKGLCRRCYTGA